VAGDHAQQMGDSLFAALGVHAVVVPFFFRQLLQDGDVGFAQGAEGRERCLGVALGILKCVRPEILVVGLNGDAILGDDLAETPAEDKFGVSEVGENFGDRPLAGGGAASEALFVEARDELLQLLRSLAVNAERVFAFDVAEDALRVLLRSFSHRDWTDRTRKKLQVLAVGKKLAREAGRPPGTVGPA
jgi:hypothetical protein